MLPIYSLSRVDGPRAGPNLCLPEKVFFVSTDTNIYPLTIGGCEPECPAPCSPASGSTGTSLVGGSGITATAYSNLFSCPPVCGTSVEIWNPANQSFTTCSFVNGFWSPSVPVLPIGYSEFVTVNTSLPVINSPGDITVLSCAPTNVYYTVTASSAFCGALTPMVTPPSGTPFNVGTTPVSIVATDCCGRSNTASFTVTVLCPLKVPVWQVTQSGATYWQATQLANLLNIPTNMLAWSNGVISYIDPTNYMAVPGITVTNTSDPAISNLIAQTKNPNPAIPIRVQAIDFETLTNLLVLETNAAMDLTSNALADAGLYPQYGAPAAGHTVLTAFVTNGDGSVTSAHQYLDTMVHYQFWLPWGTNYYSLIGAGMQLQLAYGPSGDVTRLFYSVPQVTAGPLVQIIPACVVSNSLAALLPTNARFSVQLVYWAPSLLTPPSSWSGAWNPTNILPITSSLQAIRRRLSPRTPLASSRPT